LKKLNTGLFVCGEDVIIGTQWSEFSPPSVAASFASRPSLSEIYFEPPSSILNQRLFLDAIRVA